MRLPRFSIRGMLIAVFLFWFFLVGWIGQPRRNADDPIDGWRYGGQGHGAIGGWDWRPHWPNDVPYYFSFDIYSGGMYGGRLSIELRGPQQGHPFFNFLDPNPEGLINR